jgi:hypothetical protein
MKEYFKKYPEKKKAARKKYYENHKDLCKEKVKIWHDNNVDSINKYHREYNKNRYNKFRIAVFNLLSNNNPHCVRCNCDDIRLLEINHKNGGGKKEIRNSIKFYNDILSEIRKTDDIELLCKVCNSWHYLELKYGELPYKISYDKILI